LRGPPLAGAADQAVAVEDGVDGALGRHPDIAGKTPDQKLSYLAGAPMGFVAFEVDN
jgi:hypothetical protein